MIYQIEFSQTRKKLEIYFVKLQFYKQKSSSLFDPFIAEHLGAFRKLLQAKESYLNEFFDKYSLPMDDEKALIASNGSDYFKTFIVESNEIHTFLDGTINENFFRAFKKLLDIIERVNEAVKVAPENMAL